MSVLHVGHIKAAIEKRFRNLIDVSDGKPSQREDYFLTRGLSAFVIAELSGSDDQAAADSVVDGSGDNGLDALYFDASERVCYLVQSKWIKSGNGSPDLVSALKFKEGIHDFFSGNFESFGPKINARRALIDEVLGSL